MTLARTWWAAPRDWELFIAPGVVVRQPGTSPLKRNEPVEKKELRQREATQAMDEYRANEIATMANMRRLRELRLKQEALAPQKPAPVAKTKATSTKTTSTKATSTGVPSKPSRAAAKAPRAAAGKPAAAEKKAPVRRVRKTSETASPTTNSADHQKQGVS
jgi:hypothetical protein